MSLKLTFLIAFLVMNSALHPVRHKFFDYTYRSRHDAVKSKYEPVDYDQTFRVEDTSSLEKNRIETPARSVESLVLDDCNGYDFWEGTNDSDTIIGNSEKTNFIYASWGDDSLMGGDCVDHIVAGPGTNYVLGLKGADRFYLGKYENTLILDFEQGVDRLVIGSGIIPNPLVDKNGKSGNFEGVKVLEAENGDTIVQAMIDGSTSSFRLAGVPFDKEIFNDIYVLSEQEGYSENMTPIIP